MKTTKALAAIFYSMLAIAVAMVSVAYAAPSLSIISPADGMELTPGSTFDVIVEVTEPSNLGDVLLGGPIFGGIGLSDDYQAPAPELIFSVTVPTNAALGPSLLVALAKETISGRPLESKPLNISIEEETPAIGSLEVSPNDLTLMYPGSEGSFTVTARSSEGRVMNIERSKNFSVTSSAENVAHAKPGRLFAVGSGVATIALQYGSKVATLRVTVKGSIPGDLDADGDVDSEDLAELRLWLGFSANGPADARDLNHDGRIDQADLDVLTKLCTRRLCATTDDGTWGRLPDTDPPVVRITSPLNGTAVSGKVTIAADAQDNDQIVGVQFRVNDVNLGAEDTTSPYSATWKPTSNGTYTLSAVARDPAGNRGTSSPVVVTVGKVSPTPNPTPIPTLTPTPGVCRPKNSGCTQNADCCSGRCNRGACR